nr:MAG TPA: hypothetical protein [Caudoviricetes sp.]
MNLCTKLCRYFSSLFSKQVFGGFPDLLSEKIIERIHPLLIMIRPIGRYIYILFVRTKKIKLWVRCMQRFRGMNRKQEMERILWTQIQIQK